MTSEVEQLILKLQQEVGNGMGRMPLCRLRKLLSTREEVCPSIYKALAQFVENCYAHLDSETNTLSNQLCCKIAGRVLRASQLYLLGSMELRYISIEHLDLDSDGSKLNTILLESIRRKGVQCPIRCLPGSEKFRLKVVEGSSRVLVCRILGIEKIPAFVFPPDTTLQEALEVQNTK